jgi:hypothetical protein
VAKTTTDKSAKKTKNRAEMIDALIEKARLRIQNEKSKISVADLIRLLQYRRELEAEQPKEIRVTWIDPPKTES